MVSQDAGANNRRFFAACRCAVPASALGQNGHQSAMIEARCSPESGRSATRRRCIVPTRDSCTAAIYRQRSFQEEFGFDADRKPPPMISKRSQQAGGNMPDRTVGIIGLGIMGGAIAPNLV